MKRGLCIVLCIFLLSFSGCSAAVQVENQAYVIILGLDRSEEGLLELTVQVPKIKGEGSEKGSESEYSLMTVQADSFTGALELLSITSPRRVNLTQAKMIVASEALSKEDIFPRILMELAETYTLFSTSYFVICEGNVGDFIKNQEPVFSPSISGSLTALLEHHSGHGFVPVTTFADVYYRTNSCYSDPVAILAGTVKTKSENAEQAEETPPHMLPSEIPAEAESKNEFAGGALFRNGVMVGKLDAAQMVMRSLICGSMHDIVFESQAKAIRLVPQTKPKITIETKTIPPTIRYAQKLRVYPIAGMPNLSDLEFYLENEIMNTFKTCQGLATEPFGLAERVASRFLGFSDWNSFNWHDQFSNAKFIVNIQLEIGNK